MARDKGGLSTVVAMKSLENALKYLRKHSQLISQNIAGSK